MIHIYIDSIGRVRSRVSEPETLAPAFLVGAEVGADARIGVRSELWAGARMKKVAA